MNGVCSQIERVISGHQLFYAVSSMIGNFSRCDGLILVPIDLGFTTALAPSILFKKTCKIENKRRQSKRLETKSCPGSP